MSETLIFALALRATLLGLAAFNLYKALSQYRFYGDRRGLRGFVAGCGFMGGVLALTASSPTIRDWLGPAWMSPLATLTGTGVMLFLVALVFSCLTWARAPRLRRR